MRVGITEQGDAGLDLSWADKLNTVDGAILITKELTPQFIDAVLQAPISTIVHCTCTGWGGTWLEPNVPTYIEQLLALQKLLEHGYPSSNVVLRIDPIVPTQEGIEKARSVLKYVSDTGIPVSRIRISLLDEYKHVKERIKASGHYPFYGEGSYSFGPDFHMMADVLNLILEYPFSYEVCAEDKFATIANLPNVHIRGCVSPLDLTIMGLEADKSLTENPQGRKGCHCLSCKTELLTRKARCSHGCLYCYWKG